MTSLETTCLGRSLELTRDALTALPDVAQRGLVEIEPGGSGLAATSYAKCEDLRAISPERLGRHFGIADDVVMMRIELITKRLLGLS